jgi:hypothetical protein
LVPPTWLIVIALLLPVWVVVWVLTVTAVAGALPGAAATADAAKPVAITDNAMTDALRRKDFVIK